MKKGQLIHDVESNAYYFVEKAGTRNIKVVGTDETVRVSDCVTELEFNIKHLDENIPAILSVVRTNDVVEVNLKFKREDIDFSYVTSTLLNGKIGAFLTELSDEVSKQYDIYLKDQQIREKGKAPISIKSSADTIEFSTIEVDTDASIDEQYMQIVGAITGMTKEINDSTELADTKELEELFNKATEALEGYGKIKKEDHSGWLSKLTGGKQKQAEKLTNVTSRIDYLFGIISDKFDKLVITGEKFQKLKAEMTSQIKALEVVLDRSNEELATYTSEGQVAPMRLLSINSQIAASYEAYKAKLLKIEAGITMTSGAVIALGAKLPAMRAGINDEMAFAGLLADVGNVHGMVTQAADLMLNIADNTSESIYQKVDEILTSQINDTSMIKYLNSRQEHTEKLAIMVSGKAQELSDKMKFESDTVKQIALSSSAEGSTRKLKLLNAK